MSRIPGIDPAQAERYVKEVLAAQTKIYGGPLLNHLIYGRRPTIFRGVRAMWGGLEASGLIEPKLTALVNRRVASLNHCVF
jgi:hypothetical protein